MRYVDRVTLHKIIGRGYDPTTGKNGVRVDNGVTLPCNLSPVSLEKTSAVFGSIDKQVTTVRLQRPYKDTVDVAVINGDKYKLLRHIPYKTESVLFMESVTQWT